MSARSITLLLLAPIVQGKLGEINAPIAQGTLAEFDASRAVHRRLLDKAACRAQCSTLTSAANELMSMQSGLDSTTADGMEKILKVNVDWQCKHQTAIKCMVTNSDVCIATQNSQQSAADSMQANLPLQMECLCDKCPALATDQIRLLMAGVRAGLERRTVDPKELEKLSCSMADAILCGAKEDKCELTITSMMKRKLNATTAKTFKTDCEAKGHSTSSANGGLSVNVITAAAALFLLLAAPQLEASKQ